MSILMAAIREISLDQQVGHALHDRNALFREWIQLSGDWYWEQDEEFRFTRFVGSWGPAPANNFEDSIGKHRWDTPICNVSPAQWEAHKDTLLAHKEFRDFLIQFPLGDNRDVYFSVNGMPFFDDRERFLGYRGYGRDVTSQIIAEKGLRESEERFRQLNALSSDWNWEQDDQFRLTFISDGIERITGIPAKEDLGKTRWDLASIAPAGGWASHRAQLADHLPFRDLDYGVRRRSDGATRWLRASGVPVFRADGVFIGYRGVGQDVTDKKEAELELKRIEETMRLLATRLQGSIEQERTRIAREIHDQLGSGLTGLKIDLSYLSKVSANGTFELDTRIRSMSKQIDSLVHSVRRIATELRPAELDDLGLAAALQSQLQDFQSRTGIDCISSFPIHEFSVDGDIGTAVFRICQELLTNVALHAQATTVSLNVSYVDNWLSLEVHDNGIGIVDSQITHRNSIGLAGMRERAKLFGGILSITGNSDNGTLAKLGIPMTTLPPE